MKKFLVIGNPVQHSLSPILHRQIYNQLGLAATYEKRTVKSDELPAIIAELRTHRLDGINVTIPYKEEVVPLLDRLSPEANAIGAVNCITREENDIVGYNTDYFACRRLIDDHDLIRPGRHVIVLGAGGSARSVVYAFHQAGAEKVTIVNRNPERARDLADHFAGVNREADFDVATLAEIDSSHALIWVNCTPVGMGQLSDQSPVPEHLIQSHHIVMDLIYRPLRTTFVKQADQRNAGIVSGLDFLIEQGLESNRIWFGADRITAVNRQIIIMDLIVR
ncbi:MAG: shikimate dehydrogenase [Fidelibacterota bacterium]